MTSLEFIIICNAVTKVITALGQLIWTIRQP